MNEPSETPSGGKAVGRDTRAAFSARTGGLECVLSVAAPDIENLSPLLLREYIANPISPSRAR